MVEGEYERRYMDVPSSKHVMGQKNGTGSYAYYIFKGNHMRIHTMVAHDVLVTLERFHPLTVKNMVPSSYHRPY